MICDFSVFPLNPRAARGDSSIWPSCRLYPRGLEPRGNRGDEGGPPKYFLDTEILDMGKGKHVGTRVLLAPRYVVYDIYIYIFMYICMQMF